MTNFFQGLAEGYAQGSDRAIRQKAQENSDKQLKMSQESHDAQMADHAATVKDRERALELNKKVSELLDPNHPVFGAINSMDTPEGNLGRATQTQSATGPTANASPSSGGEIPAQPRQQLSFEQKQALLMKRDQLIFAATAAAKGISPEMARDLTKQQQELMKTEEGKVVLGALQGDPQAIAAIAPRLGLDPASTKYVKKDGKAMFTDATGKMSDITPYAIAHGVYESLRQVNEADRSAKESVVADNAVTTSNFKTEHLVDDRDLEVKGKKADIAVKNSTVSKNNSMGTYYKGRNDVVAANAKTTKFLDSATKVTPTGPDGKPDINARGQIASIAMRMSEGKKGMTPEAAVLEAKGVLDSYRTQASAAVAKKLADMTAKRLDTKEYIKKNGGMDAMISSAVNAAIADTYGEAPTATADTGNIDQALMYDN